VEVQSHAFFKSVLEGGEWSASHPGRFTPGKEPLVPIVLEGGWAQNRSGRCGEKKEDLILPGMELRSANTQNTHHND